MNFTGLLLHLLRLRGDVQSINDVHHKEECGGLAKVSTPCLRYWKMGNNGTSLLCTGLKIARYEMN